jgi:hypothetical protein
MSPIEEGDEMTIKRVFHLGLFLLLFTTTAIAQALDGKIWGIYSDTQKIAFLQGISSGKTVSTYYALRDNKACGIALDDAHLPDNISMAGLSTEIDIFYAKGKAYERIPIALAVVYEFMRLSGETTRAEYILKGMLDALKTQ